MLCGQSDYFFFFQAEDGIRDVAVTGVQTCALPISRGEGADRLDERASGGACREELDRQERGQAPEDVEVVPLDDIPNGCGDDDPAKILGGETGRRHCSPSRVWVCARNPQSPCRDGVIRSWWSAPMVALTGA